jgi:hypothetical protein
MTDRHGEGIGRIMRRGGTGQAKQQPHHLLNLLLFGAPISDDGALDFRGRVFNDRTTGLHSSEDGNAARMSELERAAHVRCVKQLLDGDAVRHAAAQ